MGSVPSAAATVTILRSTIDQLIPKELHDYTTSLIRRYSTEQPLSSRNPMMDPTTSSSRPPRSTLGVTPCSPLPLLAHRGSRSARERTQRTSLTAWTGDDRTTLPNICCGGKWTGNGSFNPQACISFPSSCRNSEVVDEFKGVPMKWKFRMDYNQESKTDECWYELRFHKKDLKMVSGHYLAHILEMAKIIKDQNHLIKFHTVRYDRGTSSTSTLIHPMTFGTLALDEELKKSLIEDLTAFSNGKDYYQKIGKAWKRGYLLYGPPGTGKSSLIAAMSNFLNYSIYNLNLSNVESDSGLERSGDKTDSSAKQKLTLSGLLNAIDGLLSCCGEERIIIFTTNYKDRIDPALLRPGRMDVHVSLSYCTFQTFNKLCQNYLGDYCPETLLCQIKELIEPAKATPAEVAGELMKSRDPTASLKGLIEFITKQGSGGGSNGNAPKEEEEVCAVNNGNLNGAMENARMAMESYKAEILELQKELVAAENKLSDLVAAWEKLTPASTMR
ncbi:hypothetical protein MLD38_028690 [Melastoma candidum]|uniref:Uncharacterized protein n=1 Tax=Melastoma candidum TaxID=119954 RepID=A0ACB9N1I1_9MYRT|nr:hypothetical protein MLD38_028690 [Melastoma candidum]